MLSLWLVVLTLAGEAVATRIFYKELEDVLSLGTPVVRARVLSSRVEIGPNELRVIVQIDAIQPLRGSVPFQRGEVVHVFSTMLERAGPDGQTVRVSPIRDGSGLEQDLVPGQNCFLILDRSGRFLIRAEGPDSEPRIRRALAD